MRLINADAVYKILESYEIRKETIGNPLSDWEYGYTCGIERAESEIECAPTVDAEPVRHGKWVVNKWGSLVCSECNWCAPIIETGSLFPRRKEYDKSKYCWICGAKMDMREEE